MTNGQDPELVEFSVFQVVNGALSEPLYKKRDVYDGYYEMEEDGDDAKEYELCFEKLDS